MNAQAVHSDLDPLFEQLLEQLEHALELASLPNRADRLSELHACCSEAVRLTGKTLEAS